MCNSKFLPAVLNQCQVHQVSTAIVSPNRKDKLVVARAATAGAATIQYQMRTHRLRRSSVRSVTSAYRTLRLAAAEADSVLIMR